MIPVPEVFAEIKQDIGKLGGVVFDFDDRRRNGTSRPADGDRQPAV